MPVGCRSTSLASISDSVATGWLFATDWYRLRDGASATDSTRVFQAPQLGHLPSHFGDVPPHSVQV